MLECGRSGGRGDRRASSRTTSSRPNTASWRRPLDQRHGGGRRPRPRPTWAALFFMAVLIGVVIYSYRGDRGASAASPRGRRRRRRRRAPPPPSPRRCRASDDARLTTPTSPRRRSAAAAARHDGVRRGRERVRPALAAAVLRAHPGRARRRRPGRLLGRAATSKAAASAAASIAGGRAPKAPQLERVDPGMRARASTRARDRRPSQYGVQLVAIDQRRAQAEADAHPARAGAGGGGAAVAAADAMGAAAATTMGAAAASRGCPAMAGPARRAAARPLFDWAPTAAPTAAPASTAAAPTAAPPSDDADGAPTAAPLTADAAIPAAVHKRRQGRLPREQKQARARRPRRALAGGRPAGGRR